MADFRGLSVKNSGCVPPACQSSGKRVPSAFMPTPRTWLAQMPADAGAVLLRDLPPSISIVCEKCSRAGRYSRDGLIERFGPRAGSPDVLATLAADCPRRDPIRRAADPCGVHYDIRAYP